MMYGNRWQLESKTLNGQSIHIVCICLSYCNWIIKLFFLKIIHFIDSLIQQNELYWATDYPH